MHLITCSFICDGTVSISRSQMLKILAFFHRWRFRRRCCCCCCCCADDTSCNSYLCMLTFAVYFTLLDVLFLVALCSQFAYLLADLLIISNVQTHTLTHTHKTIWSALLSSSDKTTTTTKKYTHFVISVNKFEKKNTKTVRSYLSTFLFHVNSFCLLRRSYWALHSPFFSLSVSFNINQIRFNSSHLIVFMRYLCTFYAAFYAQRNMEKYSFCKLCYNKIRIIFHRLIIFYGQVLNTLRK